MRSPLGGRWGTAPREGGYVLPSSVSQHKSGPCPQLFPQASGRPSARRPLGTSPAGSMGPSSSAQSTATNAPTARDGANREVLSRLDVLEERFVQLENRIDERFENVDQRFEHMETRMDERFKQVDQRFEQVDQRFEQIDQRFENVDRRFDTVDTKLDRMNDRSRKPSGDAVAHRADCPVRVTGDSALREHFLASARGAARRLLPPSSRGAAGGGAVWVGGRVGRLRWALRVGG